VLRAAGPVPCERDVRLREERKIEKSREEI
jgi:hypothetical protein